MATQVNYTTEHKGTLFPSILNIPMTNGSGGAVYADQINWGDDSQFDGIPFTTTSFLLSTIDGRIKDAKANGGLNQNQVEEIVSAYYAKVSITDEQIGEKISAYISYNGVIPSISKGAANKPSNPVTVNSLSYVADFTVSEHTITPVYNTVSIPNLYKVGVEREDETYFISDFLVSGHAISPVYSKLPEYTHPAAKDMWSEYK